ncbi:MAG: class I SAM-dependent methyltransferase [Solirubrobacterales bacterium]
MNEASRTPAEVVWHELECGSYGADLALWRELADGADGPILDVGAGTGRVTLELARAGHAVTALDSDHALLSALRERADASAPGIETAHADARSFTLARDDFALCIVPMQTIQLLGGGGGRMQFLHRARAHLRPGGVLACAILGELDPFDCSQSGIGPAAEQTTRDGLLYVSRAIRVAETDDVVVIERERRILCEQAEPPCGPFPRGHEHERHDGTRERNVIELDRVTPTTLRREGVEAGLRLRPTRELAPTDEHVGSSVVMFDA